MAPIIKPKCLKPGDVVGIVAPSSPPFEEGHIQFSYGWLEKLGLKHKVGNHLFDRHGDFAGDDEARLADFHSMWADQSVAAIMPIRGGNGSVRLLPSLDFDLIKANPKVLIGFSDITGLHMAIHQRTGLVTFHGPNFGSFYDSEYTHRYFVRALMLNEPIGAVDDPPGLDSFKPTYPPGRLVIAQGEAKGPLIGGSLTLVKQLMGTPFEIKTEGKIVFLEDVGEEPHSIDRMITQLLLANKLQRAAGIIFGESIECKPGDSKRRISSLNYSVERVLRERLCNLGIPVVYGLRFGHGKDRFTVPLGVMAHLNALDPQQVHFSIDEVATSS